MTGFVIAAFFTGALIFAAYALVASLYEYHDEIRSTLSGHKANMAIASATARTTIRRESQPKVVTHAPPHVHTSLQRADGKVLYFDFAGNITACEDKKAVAYCAAA